MNDEKNVKSKELIKDSEFKSNVTQDASYYGIWKYDRKTKTWVKEESVKYFKFLD